MVNYGVRKNMSQSLNELKEAIVSADGAKIDVILRELDSNMAFDEIFAASIKPALDELCVSIQQRRGAVPELLLGLRQVKKIIEARSQGAFAKSEKVVMGVVEGDIHDMGKNVIRDVCQGYGYHVVDLGKNVSPDTFARVASAEGADIACLSTMMSTTIDSLQQTIMRLKTDRPGIRVIVGGAFMSEPLARELNADGYAKDASTVMAELTRVLQ